MGLLRDQLVRDTPFALDEQEFGERLAYRQGDTIRMVRCAVHLRSRGEEDISAGRGRQVMDDGEIAVDSRDPQGVPAPTVNDRITFDGAEYAVTEIRGRREDGMIVLGVRRAGTYTAGYGRG